LQFEIPLPANLAVAGADVTVHFRRIPARSCVVRPTLGDAVGSMRTPLNETYVYGRGEGSDARGSVHVVVRLEADVLARRTPDQNWLVLEVLELSGEPVNEPGFLELVDYKMRVRGSTS
jgi:hypothetical protein